MGFTWRLTEAVEKVPQTIFVNVKCTPMTAILV
jgi:hypothetical protein